jgi:hypothetical protein
LSVSELGPDQHTEGLFCGSEISALRSYTQVCIKLSIDDEEMIRIVGTRDKDIHLLKILDLCNFDCHYDLLQFVLSGINRIANNLPNRAVHPTGAICDLPIKNEFQPE